MEENIIDTQLIIQHVVLKDGTEGIAIRISKNHIHLGRVESLSVEFPLGIWNELIETLKDQGIANA